MQCILTGVTRRDNVVKAFAKACGGVCTSEWDGRSPVVIMGNLQGCDDIQKSCLKEKIPYIYIDHGYFRRGYDKGFFRVCVNNYHTTDFRPSGRQYSGKIRDWRRSGKTIVLLPPAEKVKEIYGCHNWQTEAINKLKKHTDRRIIVKPKGEGNLPELLQSAHAVVSYGSVADVESAMLGVPVFVSYRSPAVPIGITDLSLIESPIYPDREMWLSSLAGAEYHTSEFDKAWDRVKIFL